MRVPPKMVARVSVIPWLGPFAFHIMRVWAHLVSIKLANRTPVVFDCVASPFI